MISEQQPLFSDKSFPYSWNSETLGSFQWQMEVPPALMQEFIEKIADIEINEQYLESYQRNDIELSGLAQWASAIKQGAVNEHGVVHVTGMGEYDLSDNAQRLFYLICLLETGRTIDRYGRLYDLVDRGVSHIGTRIPVSQTRYCTEFHTDSTAADCVPDLVCLLCLNKAKSGGLSMVTSSTKVYEIMRDKAPQLLSALCHDYSRDIITPGMESDKEKIAANKFPIFSDANAGQPLTLRYMRYWVERGHEKCGLPLPENAIPAMDMLDELLDSHENKVELMLESGDMIFMNNHTVAHNRSEYEDWDDEDKKRHLVRAWIDAS